MAQLDKVNKALKDLSQHQKTLAPLDMRKAFAGRGDRFAEFSAAQDVAYYLLLLPQLRPIQMVLARK
jgi:hypothetical protein